MLHLSFCLLYFTIFASVRVTRISKAMQTTAIGTVANSLPEKRGNSSNSLDFKEVYSLYRFTKKSRDYGPAGPCFFCHARMPGKRRGLKGHGGGQKGLLCFVNKTCRKKPRQHSAKQKRKTRKGFEIQQNGPCRIGKRH